MSGLAGRRILVGVTGGIAAYKTPELIRRLREAGAEVRVVLTAAGAEFVRPLTFQAVSGEPVHHDLLDPAAEAAMGHIELARWAEAVVIAPASADIMARLAAGLADDLLSTLCLATEAPILLAPAMNRVMWAHPATRANLATLSARGVHTVGPESGDQACGEVGSGRMSEPDEIAAALAGMRAAGRLSGRYVLVTAGPTREPIDPVRFLGNRSSGRMGFAVARAAAAAGARVTLVAGPSALTTPAGVERVDVETAREMHDAVHARLADVDIFIAAAAVADYRAAAPAEEKLKRGDGPRTVELTPNPDILQGVAACPAPPFTVGFAAETGDLEANARAKLAAKGIDMIAANRVGSPGTGFDAARNALEVHWRDGHASLPETSKETLAEQLVEIVAEHYERKHSDPDS